MRKKKFWNIMLLISVLVLIFYFVPMRITPVVPLTDKDISIEVERGGNTGPIYIVKKDRDKLKKILEEKYPDMYIEPYNIELIGNVPSSKIAEAVFLHKFVVYGTIISPDGGEEKSTIIDVKYTDAKIQRFIRNDLKYEYPIINVFIAIVMLIVSIIKIKAK